MLAGLALFFAPATAFARGSVRVANPTVDEDDGRWKLKFTIDYGREPDMAMIPMVFEFKQTALYERYVDDSHPEPTQRTIAVRNASPLNLPMDVSFSDMGGKMHRVTKFTIPLKRSADFEAGEYELKVRLARGGTLGRPVKITLKGNNKVVNRKSISFSAKEPSPKQKSGPDEAAMAAEEDEGKAAEDYGLDLSDIPDDPNATLDNTSPDGPGQVGPKQGGCGCEVAGLSGAGAGWLGLLVLGLAAARRRL